jgi:hypothetical protein
MDMVRSMLEDCGLPDNLWEYATRYAVYIINRSYTRTDPKGKSAYERRFQKVPDLRHLRRFGESCVYKVQIRKKMGRKGRRGKFLGFDPQRKGYKILDERTKKIINTRDVVFTSTREPAAEIALEEEEVEAHNTKDERIQLRRSARLKKKNISSAFLVLSDNIKEPLTVREALAGPHKKEWAQALLAEIDALNKNGTWIRVRRPKGANIIKCKWVLKIKFNSDGKLEKFKARLVAKGFKQKYLVDYFETYAPVAGKETVRIFLAVVAKLHLKMSQFDVPSAYVKAKLQEEIYIELPEGFKGLDKDLGRPTTDQASGEEKSTDVLRLVKGLYGLKQAGRAWYKEVTQTLKELGLNPLASDPCLFMCTENEKILILLLYVDDIIIATNWSEKFDQVTSGLKSAYNIKELGEAKHFLGMKIQRRGDGILVTQETFVKELLRRFELENVPPRHTPLDAKEMFLENAERVEESVPYRQVVGALLYLSTCTRPDISFAVAQASKFASRPTKEHWKQLTKICGYLKNTVNYGIWFKASDVDMEVYSDADWANDPDTRKSISGIMIKAWGCPVIWQSKKQTIVATSTKAAETIAAVTALQKADMCREMLEEMGQKNDTGVVLQIDNMPAIQAMKNERPENATKHLSIRYNVIKDRVASGEVDVEYVETKNQLADIFTKALPRQQFERLRKMIKVVPAHEE